MHIIDIETLTAWRDAADCRVVAAVVAVVSTADAETAAVDQYFQSEILFPNLK